MTKKVLPLILAILFWCAGASWAEQAAISPILRKTLTEAEAALKAGECDRARQSIARFMDRYPKERHVLLYFALGNGWLLCGSLKEAEKAFEEGYNLDKSHAPLCLNYAKVRYELKDYAGAGALFEQAYRLDGQKDGQTLYQAGAAYFQAGELQKARGCLDRLLEDRKDAPRDWLRLMVHTCLKLKDWKDAQRRIQSLLNREPAQPEYWRLLADVRLKLSDGLGAVSALETAYLLEPPEARGLEDLASLYLSIDLPLRAAGVLERSFGGSPTPEQCDRLALLYNQAHHPEAALFYLDRALQKEPTAQRCFEKGKIHYQRAMWGQAAEALQACVRLEPDMCRTHLLLGFSELESGRRDEAEKAFLEASRDASCQSQATAALEALKPDADPAPM